MKKIFIAFLLIFLQLASYSKNITKDDLVGKWVAQETSMVDIPVKPEEKKLLEEVMNGLKNSKYIFHTDGRFNIEFKSGIPKSMNDLEFLNNRNWIYDEAKATISIGTPKDNYSLMKIIVIIRNDQLYFALVETPYVLKVMKE